MSGNLPWPKSNYHDPIHLLGTSLDSDRDALGEACLDSSTARSFRWPASGFSWGPQPVLLMLAATFITAIVAAALFR